MLLSLLKAKLHGGTLTDTLLHYEGSIAIDPDLLDAAGMLVHERVDIWNVTNGARFSTYIIEGKRGSGELAVNGAAARLCQKGDQVIIACFALMDQAQAKTHQPVVLILDAHNHIKSGS